MTRSDPRGFFRFLPVGCARNVGRGGGGVLRCVSGVFSFPTVSCDGTAWALLLTLCHRIILKQRKHRTCTASPPERPKCSHCRKALFRSKTRAKRNRTQRKRQEQNERCRNVAQNGARKRTGAACSGESPKKRVLINSIAHSFRHRRPHTCRGGVGPSNRVASAEPRAFALSTAVFSVCHSQKCSSACFVGGSCVIASRRNLSRRSPFLFLFLAHFLPFLVNDRLPPCGYLTITVDDTDIYENRILPNCLLGVVGWAFVAVAQIKKGIPYEKSLGLVSSLFYSTTISELNRT